MTIHRGFVQLGDGQVLFQMPDDCQWGFCLTDGDQTWEGGFGIADNQTVTMLAYDDPAISAADHEEMDWLFDFDPDLGY